MNERILALGMIVTGAALTACSGSDSDLQTAANEGGTQAALTYPNGEPMPMTPWGDPDLRGTWPIQHLIGTPFQRPEEYGTRETYTDEEFAAREEQLNETRNARYEEEIKKNKMGMGHWAETTDAQRINSLLVDPHVSFPGEEGRLFGRLPKRVECTPRQTPRAP